MKGLRRTAGIEKAEVATQYGAEQVERWRRSYDLQPPEVKALRYRHPVIPFYVQEIEPY